MRQPPLIWVVISGPGWWFQGERRIHRLARIWHHTTILWFQKSRRTEFRNFDFFVFWTAYFQKLNSFELYPGVLCLLGPWLTCRKREFLIRFDDTSGKTCWKVGHIRELGLHGQLRVISNYKSIIGL